MTCEDVHYSVAESIDKRAARRSGIPLIDVSTHDAANSPGQRHASISGRVTVHQLQLVLHVLQKAAGFFAMKAAQGNELPMKLCIRHAGAMRCASLQARQIPCGSLGASKVRASVRNGGHWASFAVKFAGSAIQACTAEKS